MGNTDLQILCVNGSIENTKLTILIDGGNTCNFIQESFVKFLCFQVAQSKHFHVMVGNGGCLLCNSIFTDVPVTFGNTSSVIDFYLLPISRADLVLGIQSLNTLGLILMDYANLTMQFQWHGQNINLQDILEII